MRLCGPRRPHIRRHRAHFRQKNSRAEKDGGALHSRFRYFCVPHPYDNFAGGRYQQQAKLRRVSFRLLPRGRKQFLPHDGRRRHSRACRLSRCQAHDVCGRIYHLFAFARGDGVFHLRIPRVGFCGKAAQETGTGAHDRCRRARHFGAV